MNNEQMDDKLFEAVLRQAVIENFENELATIPSESELSQTYTFSERHNKKMQKLFKSFERKNNIEKILKFTKVAIITISILTSILFTGVLTSAKARDIIGKIIIEWFNTFTKFQTSDDAIIDENNNKYMPKYLPDKFEINQEFDMEDIFTIIYTDEDNIEIVYTYLMEDGSVSVNNENTEYSLYIENNIEYHIFTSKTDNYENIIIWDANGYRFTIASIYDVNELIKIALSVE